MRLSLFALGKLLLLISMFSFASCFGDNTATIRFKVIASFEVDGEIREFSNVMQVEYERFDTPTILGRGGRSKTWGEALVIDMGERGRAYMLHTHYNEGSKEFSNLYPEVLLRTLSIDASLGNLTRSDINKLKEITGHYILKTYNSYTQRDIMPAFVSFSDENNPKTIFDLQVVSFSTFFGEGVKLKEINVKITDEPITSGILVTYLPWLKERNKLHFDRAPRPNPPPRSEWGIDWVITRNSFFAEQSRNTVFPANFGETS